MTDDSERWRALSLISLSTVLVLSLWFSATAVAPELSAEWGLSVAEAAWLTSAVQVGFVVGAVLSATLTISDVVAPRHLITVSALVGAGATVAIAAAVDSLLPAVVLRLLTGVALAGVVGWRWAFVPLAIGPALGTAAMLRLRVRPEARKLAGGHR